MNKKALPAITCIIPKLAPNIDQLTNGDKLMADRIRLLIHNIYVGWIYNERIEEKKEDYYHKNGWVSISATKLQSLLTQNYEYVVKVCEELNLIQVKRTENGSKSYLIHERSTPYRINPNLLPKEGARFRKEKINEYKVLKAISLNQAKRKALKNSPTSYSAMESMLGDFFFDIEKVESFINDVTLGKITLKRETTRGVIESHYLCELVNEGDFYSCVDDFGERLHTPFTNIPRELRSFLRLRGETEPLCMVDISNSQPYFISQVLNNPDKLIDVIPEFAELLNLLDSQNRGDKRLFEHLCVNGNIYEYFTNARGLKERDSGKNEIIQAILFSNHNYNREKYENARLCFSSNFPDVWSAITEIKSTKENILPFITDLYKKKNGEFSRGAYHKNMSLLCQRLESRILLGKIAMELSNNFSVASFLTVHDSFIIRRSDEKIVIDAIRQCFQGLGLSAPKMKTTYY